MDFWCILGALGVILGRILVVFWEHSGTYVGECWGMLGDAGGMLGNARNAGGYWEMQGNPGEWGGNAG